MTYRQYNNKFQVKLTEMGNRLRKIRENSKETQDEFSEKLGISTRMLQNLEYGYNIISIERILILNDSGVFDGSLSDLLDYLVVDVFDA